MNNNQELTKELVANKLPKRPAAANKGTFGKVLIIAGSDNFPGAAYLACAAAYKVGAGLVTLVTNRIVQQIVSKELPELTFQLLPGEISFQGIDAVLIGPGLGQSDQAVKLVKQTLETHLPPIVIDGDGLNILPRIDSWWEKLKGEVILTPHPGEMSRLTGFTVEQIQQDRLGTAKSFAQKWQKVVILKGANTVIADTSGEAKVSPFANPVLATAGTGDVLSGIVVGLLAQGLKPFEAAYTGVYLHGLAGEDLREEIGEAGGLASELLPLFPQIIKKLS